MARYRILIVDDQREVRRALRSAIETLDIETDVLDVPSGEEALLEISSEAVDLLISDIRLAGISGLELLEKLRRRKPDMKVILVTGLLDATIRQQVADAGADAFFIKPITMADLLDSVERCLGIVDASPIESAVLFDEPAENVSDNLTSLRKELNAISAVLLDERGRVLARAGDLPDASVETALFPALMAAFSASARVAQLLHKNPPDDLLYFSGPKYDIFLSHVGEAYALLIAANPDLSSDQLHEKVRILHEGLQGLMRTLTQLGIPLVSSENAVETPQIEDVVEEEPGEEASDLEAIFQDVAPSIAAEEADAFWDTAATRLDDEGITNADALTYDQARQLGLTPENGDSGS